MRNILFLAKNFVQKFIFFIAVIFLNCHILAVNVEYYPNNTDFSALYNKSILNKNYNEALFFLRLWFANEKNIKKRIDILFLIAKIYENTDDNKKAKRLYRQIVMTYQYPFYIKKAKEKLLELS